MKKSIILSLGISSLAGFCVSAADFKEAKVTQVVNDVQIISAADQAKKNATVNDLFSIPDVLLTGPGSRAELVAKDETVTRVGANTVFSFDPASRTIDLKQGSLLFHSPHGKGGGSIHTGSATASVLGSTLIVTTTPSGGFKVICLEDQAEIKLVNGLRQRLNPGQMTYILPGGNQLAPIIMFRLDDLTKNSLLVKGFTQPLPSMPLILSEVDRQTKLIKSGKATDTGLLAGNNATPNQVEVLDPNTIQTTVNPPTPVTEIKNSPNSKEALAALAGDATINQPSLTDASVPSSPNHIFLDSTFVLDNNSFYDGQKFDGFAARNISFNTTTANPNGLTVDLSPYVDQADFNMVAAKNMNLNGSVMFDGLTSANNLHLIAGNQFVFTPNTTVGAKAGTFELSSAGSMSISGINIYNQTGDLKFTSGSSINALNSTFGADGSLTFDAKGALNLSWAAAPVVAQARSVNTGSTGGVTPLEATPPSIRAQYLVLNSGDSILLDAAGKSFSGNAPGATASLTAPKLISVNNANMATYATINMAANTINLFNVAFGNGSTVTLKSLNGILAPNPNTGAVSVPGAVNFIQNVTYGGNPAQNYVNNGGGITVSRLP